MILIPTHIHKPSTRSSKTPTSCKQAAPPDTSPITKSPSPKCQAREEERRVRKKITYSTHIGIVKKQEESKEKQQKTRKNTNREVARKAMSRAQDPTGSCSGQRSLPAHTACYGKFYCS
jgi:hypothetical protein